MSNMTNDPPPFRVVHNGCLITYVEGQNTYAVYRGGSLIGSHEVLDKAREIADQWVRDNKKLK